MTGIKSQTELMEHLMDSCCGRYWSVNGYGVSGETAANFNDFRAFGYWNAANAKQFAQVESVCGYTVNRDVYSTSSRMAGMVQKESSQPIVGNIGLN
ncbi:hypothetical protein ANCDUO_16245 [Ancylostoma duodenale]|uniref:Uncharacterized protein n=1 Tax=Ancylostoma duodenale TaxID=51022 RepID=A0A0C2CUW5_9BILA|nr:hypothetical protein ANCDUO_16245 [Ancylostoma duodenale]